MYDQLRGKRIYFLFIKKGESRTTMCCHPTSRPPWELNLDLIDIALIDPWRDDWNPGYELVGGAVETMLSSALAFLRLGFPLDFDTKSKLLQRGPLVYNSTVTRRKRFSSRPFQYIVSIGIRFFFPLHVYYPNVEFGLELDTGSQLVTWSFGKSHSSSVPSLLFWPWQIVGNQDFFFFPLDRWGEDPKMIRRWLKKKIWEKETFLPAGRELSILRDGDDPCPLYRDWGVEKSATS